MELAVPDTDCVVADAFALGAAAALASVAAAAAESSAGADIRQSPADRAPGRQRHSYCLLCSHEIAKFKQGRPHGEGRAHVTCILGQRRTAAAPSTPIPRAKRPYESLKPTQKWVRRTKARAAVTEVLDDIGCPIEAIVRPVPVTPTKVLHFSPAERQRTRTIRRCLLPAERTMSKTNLRFATVHATETGTFAKGAYITDPLRFVSDLCAQSSHLAVGGDCGGGHCKLGVSFRLAGKQHFAALLVYDGGDTYEDLYQLTAEGTTRFVGASAPFTNIFQILQHLIDSQGALLNGDWLFLNVVLGLKNACAKHPCPICIVSDKSFLRTARYRTARDKHSHNKNQPALLTIASDRIVPTPLHVYLGLGDRIVRRVFPLLFGEQAVLEAVKRIKTVHSAGCTGLSDLYGLNGQEITKWIKKKCSAKLLGAIDASPEVRASHSILAGWLEKMHHALLHGKEWTATDSDSWRAVVTDIHQHWVGETQIDPFPKLHMLHHTLDFAERYRFLGAISEAQMESYHGSFNKLFHHNHRNMSSDTPERMRRCLARASTRDMRTSLLRRAALLAPHA